MRGAGRKERLDVQRGLIPLQVGGDGSRASAAFGASNPSGTPDASVTADASAAAGAAFRERGIIRRKSGSMPGS